MKPAPRRCPWPKKPLDIAYHDTEWGVPLRDDRALFELLTLEGAQAGLSWSIVLAKRENYRRAFDQFDVAKIARYGPASVRRLLADPGIVRNRLKVAASITNARAVLALRRGSAKASATTSGPTSATGRTPQPPALPANRDARSLTARVRRHEPLA